MILFGSLSCSTCVITIRQLVFPTLPVIQITVGVCFFTQALAREAANVWRMDMRVCFMGVGMCMK